MKKVIKKFIPSFLLDWYHFFLAFLGALIYGFPSRLCQSFDGQVKKLKIIGITGTNGKSTVIEMISGILEEAGFKVAALSSIKLKVADQEEINMLKMTMPGRFTLQRFLKQAVVKKCDYAILEVTSEGIKQHRHRFIDFDIAVFTNLSPEHIESHGSFEKYRQAKEKLFQITKNIHVLNIDDDNVKYFLKYPADKKYVYGYGLRADNLEQLVDSKKNTVYKILSNRYEANPKGVVFELNNEIFRLNLLGKFNTYNALAAISVALSQGISLEVCKKALEKIEKIPGRMEMVIASPFNVIIDYAFTPNALEKVYNSVKSNFKPSKMICVLGSAGGGRDKWKRPVLGRIAKKYCDKIIITNEDPYDENPMEIINQVAEGAGPNVQKILDRREAIRDSLKQAEKQDLIIITGKGCEPWICVEDGKKIPWDDRDVVREEFKKNKGIYGVKK